MFSVFFSENFSVLCMEYGQSARCGGKEGLKGALVAAPRSRPRRFWMSPDAPRFLDRAALIPPARLEDVTSEHPDPQTASVTVVVYREPVTESARACSYYLS